MKIRKPIQLAAFICIAALLMSCGQNYSTGSRVEVVIKLSNKGLIWKSWEGEMNMGGVREETDDKGKSQMVLNAFTFNVDQSCVEAIRQAQQTGKRVELFYRQWFISPPSIENSYVIIQVKILE